MDKHIVKIINPSADSRWDEFIENHPSGCVFHHSAWKQVLENSFPQLRPCYLIAEDNGGTIKGALPLFLVKSWLTGTRLVSIPFSLYCDPLVCSQGVFDLLINWVLSKQSKFGQSYVEIRTRFKGDLFKASKFKEFSGFKNHTLRISPNKEELRKTFNRTCVRQRINRAEKSNITVKEASSEADVRIFYELHCLTRKKYGVPVQPYKFFKNMWEILHPKNMFGVFIARHEGQPVSALLFLKFKKRVHAEYMGTNDAFLKYSPNILLFWKAILKSKNDGYQNFDFGGSQADNIPLIKFKRRWGTVEENLVHYYFPEIRGLSAGFERSKKFSVLTQLCKKMPVPLFKWAGNRLYCHFGG